MNSKKIIAKNYLVKPIALIISTFLLLACSKEKFAAGIYVNKEIGFSIHIPDGWIQGKTAKGNVTTFNFYNRSDFPADASISITVFDVPSGTTLEDVYERYRSTLIVDLGKIAPKMSQKEVYEEFNKMHRSASSVATKGSKEIDSGETTLDTIPAKWLSFTHIPKDMQSVTLKSILYVAVKDGRAYAVGCEAFEKYYSEFEGDFDRATKSFKFLN
ncbi:MAG: PsbP-related protein [Nitrospirota bacterium]